jgi:hypothetical protein
MENAARPVARASPQWRRRACGSGPALRVGRGAGFAALSVAAVGGVGGLGVLTSRPSRRPRRLLWPVGARLAVAATVRTGRRSDSDTSATMTGAAAAPSSVPGPQMRATANDAAADATLAMISVWGEMRECDGGSLGPASGFGASIAQLSSGGRGRSTVARPATPMGNGAIGLRRGGEEALGAIRVRLRRVRASEHDQRAARGAGQLM